MPSTYTTNNGLEKIGTGEQSGTWGDTTNLNFDILDQALDGLVTITATDTGSSGSPNSLPITDGTLSDGRNRLIIITDGGDLGGSVYYQLTPADAEKIVFLRNSLSGSRDLILFQGSYNAARDLIVPAGKDVIVKFSGTGTSTAVVAPVFADLSLDAATIASADINGGTIDGVTIGVTSVATVINVDNLKLDGNTLSSTDTNGNVVLAPNGDGDVQLDADTVRVGDNNNDVTITTNGTGDLTLNTNGGTNSGSIEIQDGVNTNIIVTANGTGKLELANGDITTSASSGSDAAGQDLTIQAGASTGNAAGGDMIFQTTPAGAGSGTSLNSYTTVLTLTDDSKMQIGTSTAVDSILDEDDMSSNSDTALATQQSIKAYVDAQVGTVDTLAEVLANGNTTGGTDIAVSTGDDITFADNSKALFGADNDLQIFHDVGGTTHIRESGSSHLYIEATNLRLKSSADTGETYLTANVDGAVSLYYDNVPTLATTSTGVDITGTLVSDGLTVDKTATISTTDYYASSTFSSTLKGAANNTKAALLLNSVSSSGQNAFASIHSEPIADFRASLIGTYSADGSGAGHFSVKQFLPTSSTTLERMRIDENGDITFYDTDGTTASFVYDADAGTTFNDAGADRDFRVASGSFTHMFYVDAANNRIGISRSNPAHKLDVNDDSSSTSTPLRLTNSNTTSGTGVSLQFTNTAFGGDNEGEIRYVNNGANNNNNFQFFGEIAGVNGMVQLGAFEGGGGQWVTQRGAIFNESGIDSDFQVKSDSNDYALFVDAGNSRVGVGTSTTYGTLTVNGSISNTGTYDGGYYYSPYEILSTSVAQNSPRYIILARTGSSGRFINGTIYGARSTASSATRTQRYDVAVAVNSSGAIQHANVTQYGYAPSSVVEVRTFTYDGADYVGLYIGSSGSSAYPTGYYFEGIASSVGEVIAVDDSLPTSVAAYTGTVGNTGLRNQSFLVYNGSTVLNESGGDYDFQVKSDSNDYALFVDAGSNHVNIGTSSDLGQVLNVEGGLALGTDPTVTWTSNYLKFQTRSASVPVIEFLASTSGSYAPRIDIFNGAGTLQHRIDAGGDVTFNNTGSNLDFRVASDNESNMFFLEAGNDRIFIGGNASSYDANRLNIRGPSVVPGGTNGNVGIYSTDNMAADVGGSLTFGGRYSTGGTYYMFGGIQAIKRTATSGDASGKLKLYYVNNSNATIPYHIASQDEIQFNPDGNDVDFRVASENNSSMLFVNAEKDTVRLGNGGGNSAPLSFHKSKSSRYYGKYIDSTSDAAAKVATLMTIDSWQSSNSRLFGTVTFWSVNPVGDYANHGRASFFAKNAASGTGNTVTTFTELEEKGTMALPTLTWTGTGLKTLTFNMPAVAYQKYIVDITFVTSDGATTTLYDDAAIGVDP